MLNGLVEPISFFIWSEPERRVWKPKEGLTVSQWAAKYRFVTKGPAQGLWSNELTPYLVEPMDAWNLPWVRHIILCFAPQTGKTSVAINCLLYSIDQDPGPVMYIMPDEHVAKRISNRQLIPTIKATPRTNALLSKRADDVSTLSVKFTNGMDMMMAWAGSASAMASESIRYLFRDEPGKYPDFSGREADPFSLSDVRMNTYTHTSKVMDFSTPNLDGDAFDKICKNEPDEIKKLHARCPKCGTLQEMKDENIHAFGERDYRIIKRKNLARYTCIDCGDAWNDGRRNEAVRHGQWVATKGVDRPRCLMFGELPSWYSPFVSLSTVLGEFFKSKNDPQKYMAYVTQHQARAWKEVLDKKDDVQILSHKTDMEPGIVPLGCIALTAGIDMQKYGFWFVVRAWEPDLTSHLVQYGQLSSWEEVEYLVFESRYEISESAGETMGIWRAAIDTGGGKSSDGDWSRTEEAYQWIRSHRPGVVFGIKGRGGKATQLKRITVSVMDKMPSSNRPIPGGLELRILDVDQFKDLLHWRLSRKRGEGQQDSQCFYLHKDTGEDYAQQFLAEEKRRDRNGKVEWVPIRRDNHLLDCEVMAAACADSEWFPSLSMLAISLESSKDNRPRKEKRRESSEADSKIRYNRPDWLNR
ncbi:phage terminase GpA [Desulfosarcina variabilis str. Montpellier]|uniref:terminase gpA endonuclease subunit n=1 Tax=Desulfosarcina variabilis TaxID=2300 RepID=UPI003AFB380C